MSRTMSTSRPALSVIHFCHNDGHLVRRQLDAICAQGDQILELLLLDDGSTDDSYEIFQTYADKYPFVRVLRNKKNMGIPYSIDRLMSEVRGEFVTSQGADDRVLPGFFKSAVDMLRENPTAAYACGDGILIYEKTGRIARKSLRIAPSSVYIKPEELAEFIRAGSYLFALNQATVYRRSALAECGDFRADLKPLQEYFAQLVCGFRHGFCYTHEAMCEVRMSSTTWSQKQRRDMRVNRFYAKRMGCLFLSDEFSDIRPLVARSGLLAQFPGMFYLLVLRPKDRSILSPRKWMLLIVRELYCLLPRIARESIKKTWD